MTFAPLSSDFYGYAETLLSEREQEALMAIRRGASAR